MRRTDFKAGGIAVAVLLARAAFASAQVTTDGSLGARQSFDGRGTVLPAALGRERGANLFHSFERFDIPAGGRVTFTGPAGTANVLARVTGGGPSRINGTLANGIAGANTFLINPRGIVFGAGAALDVSGSFAATTADVVHFADGGRFSASLSTGDGLTVAPVSGFGFLGRQGVDAAGVRVVSAALAVPGRGVLSLVGGDVSLDGATLASGGRVNLVARRGPGTVAFDPASLALPVIAPIAGRGNVTMANGAGVFAAGGGRVDVHAGDLSLANLSGIAVRNDAAADAAGGIGVNLTGGLTLLGSEIATTAAGAGRGGPIDIAARDVTIRAAPAGAFGGVASRVRSTAGDGDANTPSTGDGGSIRITAAHAALDAAARPDGTSGIFAESLADTAGDAGAIDLSFATLDQRNAATIGTFTSGPGAGGAVTLSAENATLDGAAVGTRFTSIAANTFSLAPGAGDAGDVRLRVGRLRVGPNAGIDTRTFGAGDAGGVAAVFNKAVFAGDRTTTLFAGITAATASNQAGAGDAGAMNLRFGSLEINTGAEIEAGTNGPGRGGDIAVRAKVALIDGANVPLLDAANNVANITGITVQTNSVQAGAGDGGRLDLRFDQLRLTRAGSISAVTNGTGDGGQIRLIAGDALIDGTDTAGRVDFTGINTRTEFTGPGGGDGGAMDLRFGTLETRNGAIVANTGGTGTGGSIRLHADVARLDGIATPADDISGIIAQSNVGSTADAGSMTLTFGRLAVVRGAVITANTFSSGDGGSIELSASRALLDGAGSDRFTGITASSSLRQGTKTPATGDAGAVNLRFGRLDVANGAAISTFTEGSGDAGGVNVCAADSITLRDAATVSARSFGRGNAGSIVLRAGESIEMRNAVVAADTPAAGGNVTLDAGGGTVRVRDRSTITADAAAQGNIAINAARAVIIERSTVTATADTEGGRISIDPRFVVLNNSLIDGTSAGTRVRVSIDPLAIFLQSVDSQILADSPSLPPDVDVTGALSALRLDLGRVDLTLLPSCGAMLAQTQAVSSFTVSPRNGLIDAGQ